MKHLKLIASCLAFVLFGVAVAMFAVSFLDQVTSGVLNGRESWGNGFDILKSDLDASNKLGTIFALVFIGLGVLASCYAVFVALTKGNKKSKKGDKTAKLLCACCTFVLCGVVPAVLLFLTKQTTGVGLDVNAGILGGTKTTLGAGAIMAAIFSVVGAGSLAVAELN